MCVVLTALVAACLALSSVPATAMDWQRYENARFGYVLDVPPGFPETGDYGIGRGKIFSPSMGVTLTVLGADNPGDFEAEFAWLLEEKESQGFGLEASTSTPTWASYTGRSVGRTAELRAIATCGGSALAVVELIFPSGQRDRLAPVVERLAASLRATDSDC